MGLQKITFASRPPDLGLTGTVYRLQMEEIEERPASRAARLQFGDLELGTGTIDGGERVHRHHISVTGTCAETPIVVDSLRNADTGYELSGVLSGFTAISDSTGVESRSNEMSALSQAAEMEDTARFVSLAEQIDWFDLAPKYIVMAIHWALQLGAHSTSRLLAEEGHRRYPDQAEITRLYHVTAPPRALRRVVAPDSSVRKNKTWLEENGVAYRGLWIALDAGDLVACADTVSELKDRVGELKGYLVTKVR